jgi:hypothetical protein
MNLHCMVMEKVTQAWKIDANLSKPVDWKWGSRSGGTCLVNLGCMVMEKHGVYMSVGHMSSNIDLIFMIYRFYKIYIKFSLWSHFLHPLQHRFIMFGPNIYHGRYLSDLHVSPIFDLIFSLPVLLNMIRSVSPLHVPYHLGSPALHLIFSLLTLLNLC